MWLCAIQGRGTYSHSQAMRILCNSKQEPDVTRREAGGGLEWERSLTRMWQWFCNYWDLDSTSDDRIHESPLSTFIACDGNLRYWTRKIVRNQKKEENKREKNYGDQKEKISVWAKGIMKNALIKRTLTLVIWLCNGSTPTLETEGHGKYLQHIL